MKKLLTIPFLILFQFILFAQNESYTIPLKTNWASYFEFITNNHDKACLLLKQRDKYSVTLLDSNYRVLAEFQDRFYTASTPTFVGSIVDNNRFELFFKRVEDDVLLVLVIDAENETLTRVKDFKIAELPKEKVIFTGSNYVGDKMTTISITNSTLILKKHLPGLITENISVQLSMKDEEFINEADYTQIKADSCYDSLVMVFCKGKNTSKSPQYRLFNIDLKTGQYNSVDFNCDHKKNRYRYSVKFIDSLVVTNNCKDSSLQLYNRLTGDFINEFSIDYDEIIANENIPLFKYSYEGSFSTRTSSGWYGYLKGRDRRGIWDANPQFDFVKDSLGVQFEIIFYCDVNSLDPVCNIRTLLPFDMEKMEIDMNGKFQEPKEIESIKYHLGKMKWLNHKVSGYFFGFNGEKMFGYLQKKPKAFIVERVDL